MSDYAKNDEMYENIVCPRCKSRGECEDLRRTGNYMPDAVIKPHKERITAYRTWKLALREDGEA